MIRNKGNKMFNSNVLIKYNNESLGFTEIHYTKASKILQNVLLISNYLSKNGNWQGQVSPDVLYNILSQMNKVSFTVLDPYDTSLDTIGINYLKKFHLQKQM